MIAKKSILLILPYFGHFNNYFNLWLVSVKFNPTIDWLIFTDDKTNYDYPPNVTVRHISFSDFTDLVQQKFDFQISLDKPYKLCDLKPAYGFIFDHQVKGYDFWGHCDNDLVFGDIRKFITEDILVRYSRILSRGHLSIYKNNDFCNQFFMRNHSDVPHYKTVFSSSKNFSYDEWGGTSQLWKSYANELFFDEIIFDDIYISKKHFLSVQKITRKVENKKKSQIYNFNEGTLNKIYLVKGNVCREETLYVHLQKREMENLIRELDPTSFLIVPNKFISFPELTRATIFWFGRARIFYSKFFIFKYDSLVFYIKNLVRIPTKFRR
jgi:hypothetical protein